MKPNYLTILITTLCIFFNACHNSNTAPQLQLADSLIDKRADSALCILEKLSIEEISNKSAKAMYALLLTEALDKNFKSHRLYVNELSFLLYTNPGTRFTKSSR